MYNSNPTPSCKRKPYTQPALTRVYPQEAELLLQNYADRDDENTRVLLRHALIGRADYSRPRERNGGETRMPQPSFFRRIFLAATICLLSIVPATLLITAVSAGSFLQAALAKFSLLWFPVWVTFTLWVTLDASALFGLAGPRPDPFGPKALSISTLGIANILSTIAFLFVVKIR